MDAPRFDFSSVALQSFQRPSLKTSVALPSSTCAPGFDTYVVRDATCSFDEGWAGEMDLELAAAGVKTIDSSKVPALRREEAQHEISMSSIANHTRQTRIVSRSRPSHLFTSEFEQKPELLERAPVHIDLDV